ncbi:hypothetical protein NT6N_16840 [Oceaniferula spumae]|uniref:Protein kinase domain-containing protein n=1 Tax=Oceaniferula spumae TaxID=2979115 RepID=A0AAT9FL02_9BACT
MKPSVTDQANSTNQSSTENVSDRILPFVDQLYEEGDPSLTEAGEDGSQTPLYDNLRGLEKRYTEQTLVATGGMKEIYRALDKRTSRHVAIARPIQTLGKDHYDAFLREAHITARLEHPGIIKLFGMDVDEEGRPFFTMEFKTGHSLRKLINDHKKGRTSEPWPLSQRLSIILRICESLSYAHSRRVLHLDIKPDNIQVGSFGEVQLCDWGMGIVMKGEENKETETLLDPDLYGSLQRKIKGTPAYMAPELFDARTPKTEQMDIYALGCLMEELIEAEPPESANHNLIKDSPLHAVVLKAKAKDPRDRYASVAQMQHDITRYLDGFTMSVEPSSIRRELILFYQRHRTVCNLTAAFLLLFIAALSIFLSSLNKSRNEARTARDRAITALADLEEKKRINETRLKSQAAVAQKDSTQLIYLEFSDQIDLKRLTNILHARLDAVIANEPDDQDPIWVEKFWLNFLTQRFDEAVAIHEAGKSSSPDLLPLAYKYAGRMDGKDFLATEDFIELLSDLFAIHEIPRAALADKMIRYDLSHARPTEDREEIIHLVVKQLNPNWKERTFSYTGINRSLRLSGDGLVRLKPSKNLPSLLDALKPRRLDIRGSSINSAEQLTSLKLTEIDIRFTPIKSLQPLGKIDSLSRLIVAPGQFSKAQLAELPSYVEVIVRK